MVASRVRSGETSTGKAAQPVGLKPFPAQSNLQVGRDALIKANHIDAPRSERRDFVENLNGFPGCLELIKCFGVNCQGPQLGAARWLAFFISNLSAARLLRASFNCLIMPELQ